MKTKDTQSAGTLAKTILLWCLFGWWVVPILLVLRFLAESQEHFWTGDNTKIYWHTDESMTKAIRGINTLLKKFFP
jgi:hypothetical protein